MLAGRLGWPERATLTACVGGKCEGRAVLAEVDCGGDRARPYGSNGQMMV